MCNVADVNAASSAARCTATLADSEPSVPTTIDVNMTEIVLGAGGERHSGAVTRP